MGYLSVIKIALPTNQVIPNDIQIILDDCFDMEIVENITYYTSDAIKWYDGDDEVEAVMDFLHNLKDEDGEDNYQYIRIGEDIMDIDYQGNYDFGMYVTRTIEIN